MQRPIVTDSAGREYEAPAPKRGTADLHCLSVVIIVEAVTILAWICGWFELVHWRA